MTLRRVGNIQFSKGKHKKEIGSRSNVQANTDSVKPNYSVRTQMTDKSSSENLNQRSFNIQRTASVKSNKGSRWNGIIKGVEGPVYIKPHPEENIPRLHHHLSRVLFNPGVHFLRDPRSKVYNFDPYVQRIPQPEEFNWDLIPPFIPPSNDQYLKELAEKSNAKFTGSTSSISESLSQIYFFLSSFKRLHLKDKFTSEFCVRKYIN